MSATRSFVVLWLRLVPDVLAEGVLRPQLRWSNSTILYIVGSKNLRCAGVQPEPGPPWSTRAGLPSGFPQISQ
jgi:hypothetical protein